MRSVATFWLAAALWSAAACGCGEHSTGPPHWTADGGVLYAVWGNASEDVWAVGAHGSTVHWDGRSWSAVRSTTVGELRAVWGASATDVWTVGNAGTIIHWDGTAWSQAASPAQDDLSTLWVAEGDGWAWGPETKLRLTDGEWLVPDTFAPVGRPGGVWGSAAQSVWLTGQRPAWTPPAPDEDVVLRWDGSAWTEAYLGDWQQLIGIGPLWGTGPDNIWIVGQNNAALGTCSVLRWDGSTWELTPLAGSAGLNGISGSAEDDVWIVGAEGIVWHYDGQWSLLRSGPMGEDLFGVWAANRNDGWAVGRAGSLGLILHWDGSTWSYWE